MDRASVAARSRARAFRIRRKVLLARMARGDAIRVAAARVPGLRSARLVALEARAAARVVSRMQTDAGGNRRSDADDCSCRSTGLADPPAAAEGIRQSLALLELVRSADSRRQRRSGDCRCANPGRRSP